MRKTWKGAYSASRFTRPSKSNQTSTDGTQKGWCWLAGAPARRTGEGMGWYLFKYGQINLKII
ncbi:hypothetical protein SFRURICE_021391 [Spodoptera frugiperda]|nr:hypothetical protein SFRURICE_021391 [Spodoptera frugiperda]